MGGTCFRKWFQCVGITEVLKAHFVRSTVISSPYVIVMLTRFAVIQNALSIENITTAVPHSKLARGVQPQGKRSALQDQSNKYCVPDSTVKKPLSQLSKDIPRESE